MYKLAISKIIFFWQNGEWLKKKSFSPLFYFLVFFKHSKNLNFTISTLLAAWNQKQKIINLEQGRNVWNYRKVFKFLRNGDCLKQKTIFVPLFSLFRIFFKFGHMASSTHRQVDKKDSLKFQINRSSRIWVIVGILLKNVVSRKARLKFQLRSNQFACWVSKISTYISENILNFEKSSCRHIFEYLNFEKKNWFIQKV